MSRISLRMRLRLCEAYLPAASFVDVENPTRFHCHTKVATKYRSGRVFLAGDAAHLCSPSEGHGMNCGLQDAFNLAWKLALVHDGAADPVLLDSYEIERRPVAERVMQSGDGFEYALTVSDTAECDKRDQNIRAKLADAKTLHHEVAAETELIADYCGSPIVFGDANSMPCCGTTLARYDSCPIGGGAGSQAARTWPPRGPYVVAPGWSRRAHSDARGSSRRAAETYC